MAYGKYSGLLNRNFDDVRALYGLAKLYLDGELYGLAFNLFRVCASFKKLGSAPWNGMGMCQAETYDLDAALYLFRKAHETDPNDANAMGNLSLAHLLRCEPDKALKYGRMALEKDPNFDSVKHHITYANLLLKNWKEGWAGHRDILGKVKTRTERYYESRGRMLPRWNGEHGQTVLVYGEQGKGDEISFASCIPDLQKVSKKVIFDCDHGLESLFRRSFPEIQVYGTRFKDPSEWLDEHDIDARVAIGDLPSFFRNSDAEFPGTPYLKAPEKSFDGIRPVIGIAWTGGKPNTGSAKRSMGLEEFLPILKAIPATWVSLEYKNRADEIAAFRAKHGIEILEPAEAASKNYDDVAGLVGSMDLVISVTTAVVHLSGAIGKECWCIAPNCSRWFYGVEGELPWYKSVKMFRQGKGGSWPMGTIARLLKLRYSGL